MKKLLTSLVLLWAMTGIAQTFQPGYIITNENDTIHGNIKYQNSNASALRCIFQKTGESEEIVYTPNNINGYRFENGKYYVSKSVSFDGKTQPLFLEYIVDGIVDLYCFYHGNKPYYFISNDDGLYYLPEQENVYYKNGKEYRTKDTRYIGILKNIFKESPTIIKKTETTKLNHQSLIQISKDYHVAVCEGEKCIVYKKEKTPRTKKLGILYGWNTLKIYTYSSYPYPNEYLSKFKTNYEPFNTLGISIQWNFPELNKNLFVRYTLMNGNVKHKGTTNHNGLTKSDTVVIDQSIIFNNISILYQYPGKRIQPYIAVGGSLNLAEFDFIIYSGEYYSTKDKFSHNFNSLSASIGCSIKIIPKLELNVETQYQQGIGYFKDFKISHLALQSGIAYVF